ncbi:MAG TPA: ATP-binding protein, partial [Actinomycetota bacterium]
MGRGSVVARERELEAISSFLDADPTHGHVLLLGGEAGIGKSSLWRAGTEMAAARGYRVLSAAAGQSETRISFTTLRDLFTGPFDDVAGELP